MPLCTILLPLLLIATQTTNDDGGGPEGKTSSSDTGLFERWNLPTPNQTELKLSLSGGVTGTVGHIANAPVVGAAPGGKLKLYGRVGLGERWRLRGRLGVGAGMIEGGGLGSIDYGGYVGGGYRWFDWNHLILTTDGIVGITTVSLAPIPLPFAGVRADLQWMPIDTDHVRWTVGAELVGDFILVVSPRVALEPYTDLRFSLWGFTCGVSLSVSAGGWVAYASNFAFASVGGGAYAGYAF